MKKKPKERYLFLGLSHHDPRVLMTEPPTSNGYQRVAVDKSFWGKARGGQNYNLKEIAFPRAYGDWGLVGWVFLIDEDNYLQAVKQLQALKEIIAGDQVVFEIGDLKWTAEDTALYHQTMQELEEAHGQVKKGKTFRRTQRRKRRRGN